MSRIPTFRELFRFNDWARDRLLGFAAPLTAEQLDRPFAMGPGSLRKTLGHLCIVERVWLDRWLGKNYIPDFDRPGRMTLDEMRAEWPAAAVERNALLESAGDKGLEERIEIRRGDETYHFALADMMLHVVNHGTHHRAQAYNMLRHVGAQLPARGPDYIFMRLEMSEATPPAPAPQLDLKTLRQYYDYADWQRALVDTVAAGLSDADLDRKFEMGVGTLRQTFAHILFAERWWYNNWIGKPDASFPETPPNFNHAEICGLFNDTVGQRNAYLTTLKDTDLTRVVEARPRPGIVKHFPLGVTMLQICGHGTHHRAQAINMLRQLGRETPKNDLILFVRERMSK